MKEELLKDLSEEQIAKIKACKNTEEMLAVAKEEGVQLNDEQLEAVSGGVCTAPEIKCPKCGCTKLSSFMQYSGYTYICTNCNYKWDGWREH